MKRNIIYDYLDTENAVIALLKDYKKYEYILKSVDNEILELENQMHTLGAVKLDGMPRGTNVRGREGYIVDLTAQKDMCIEKKERASEYMKKMTPALSMLDDDEFEIINGIYINGQVPVKILAQDLGYAVPTIHKMKDEAVAALSLILYGR